MAALRRRRVALRRLVRATAPPASKASYLAHAEASLSAAAACPDPIARALHEDECKLWLMLARQRQAIELVLQRYVDEPDAA